MAIALSVLSGSFEIKVELNISERQKGRYSMTRLFQCYDEVGNVISLTSNDVHLLDLYSQFDSSHRHFLAFGDIREVDKQMTLNGQ